MTYQNTDKNILNFYNSRDREEIYIYIIKPKLKDANKIGWNLVLCLVEYIHVNLFY